MRVTKLSPAERAIVELTLALANAKHPPGTGSRGLFDLQRFIKPRLKPHVAVESLVTIDPQAVEKTRGKITDDVLGTIVRQHHMQLRKWLSQITRQGTGAYAQVAPEVGQYLPRGNALRPTLREGRIVYQLTTHVIPGLFAFGTALILDRDRGLTQRLGQCGYCGRFNLTFDGRPRMHCSQSHRLAYDRKMAAERARARRKRQKNRGKR